MALKDLAVEFNEVLGDYDLGDFRIRDVAKGYTNKRQLALEFDSSLDALRVQEKFDGFEFVAPDGSCYNIRAKIQTNLEEAEPCTEVVISTTTKSDYYEISDSLDMQIDMFKKQVLALKAHRKLLREKKKLKREYSKWYVDSDDDTPEKGICHKHKRERKPINSDSDSSDSDDEPFSRNKKASPPSPSRKRSKSPSFDDYVDIKHKKVSSSRKSKSPTVRSRDRKEMTSKLESHKRRSRPQSCEKYRKSMRIVKSSSPDSQSSRHRVSRSESRDVRRICRSKSRDKHRILRSKSRDLHRIRRSKSRDKHRMLRSMSRDMHMIRRSKSRDMHRIRRSKTRDKHRIHRSMSRDMHKKRRFKSRDKHRILRSKSRDRHRVLRSKSRERRPYANRSNSRDRKRNLRLKSRDRHTVNRSKSRDILFRSKSREWRSSRFGSRRSRSREKYYSVETLKYKKSLLRGRSPSRSKYDRKCVVSPKSFRLRRSPYGYEDTKFDYRKNTQSSRRSRSPFKRKQSNVDSSTKSHRNRSPSIGKRSQSEKKRVENESHSKFEPPDNDQRIEKATDKDWMYEVVQSKTNHAIEIVIFEMELLLRKESIAISIEDKDFLTSLVKGIVTSRFQKFQIHHRMMVSDIVTRYRSVYSNDDDKLLLRNLAAECKSLIRVARSVVASTAEVPSQPSSTQNDEIWSAVDEVLDGVDLDLLQADPEINEIRDNNTDTNKPKDIDTILINSTSEGDFIEVTNETVAVNINPKMPKTTIDKAHGNITSLTIDLIEDVDENDSNTIDPTKHAVKNYTKSTNVTKLHNVKIESIELSDISDSELDDVKTNDVTSTVEDTDNVSNYARLGQISVKSFAAGQNSEQDIIITSVNKENIVTFDLTEDTDDERDTNDDQTTLIATKTLTRDIGADNNNNASAFKISKINQTSCIKLEERVTVNNNWIPANNDKRQIPPTHSNYIKQEKDVANKTGNDELFIVIEKTITSSINNEPAASVINSVNSSDNMNIKQSMKQENDVMDIRHSKNCAEVPEISNNKLNKTIPVRLSRFNKKESTKNKETTVINDQILIPITDTVKIEAIETAVCVSAGQTDAPNILYDILNNMHVLLKHVKQENEALNSNPTSKEVSYIKPERNMPIPTVVSSIKQENIAIDIGSASQINIDQIKIPVPLILKQENIPNITNSIIIDISDDERSKSIPKSKKHNKSKDEKEAPVKHAEEKDIKTEQSLNISDNIQNNVGSIYEDIVKSNINLVQDKEPTNRYQNVIQIDNKYCKKLPENPRFVIPTRVIMRPLKSLIKKSATENSYLHNITKLVLKNRFKELVKDKVYLKAKHIIKMYRTAYAEEKYADFIEGILADIKAGKYDKDIREIAIQEKNQEQYSAAKKN